MAVAVQPMSVADTNCPTREKRQISAWELPSLLAPLYAKRRTIQKPARLRSHFSAILAFVFRNRFAIGSQIQRRFPEILRSERTTRRHLEELESLGLLDVVPTRGLGPNFPKVYFVTAEGTRLLRKSLKDKGTAWEPGRSDRPGQRRREGYSSETVIHEILITEFLLAVWETVERREDLELLTVQRRSLAKHPSFQVTIGNRPSRLIPDGMFLFRQKRGGMCCCFLELDNGTMNAKQIRAKYARYVAWSQSTAGQRFLTELYRRHGAKEPKPVFRLLMVARSRTGQDDHRRMAELAKPVAKLPAFMQDRMWFTTVADLCRANGDSPLLEAAIWWKGREMANQIDAMPTLHTVFPNVIR
jgi:hypothetical protein